MSDDQLAALLARVGLRPDDLDPALLDVARGHVTDEKEPVTTTPRQLIAAALQEREGNEPVDDNRRTFQRRSRAEAAGVGTAAGEHMEALAARIAAGDLDPADLGTTTRIALGLYQRAAEATKENDR